MHRIEAKRVKFMFRVHGENRVGIEYTTLTRNPDETDDAMLRRATVRVAKRSGDAAPVLLADTFGGGII